MYIYLSIHLSVYLSMEYTMGLSGLAMPSMKRGISRKRRVTSLSPCIESILPPSPKRLASIYRMRVH